MALKPSLLSTIHRLSPPYTLRLCNSCRSLHSRLPTPPVPKPTPFVPDTQTFLKLIGRNLSAHAAKFQSWDALFTLRSPQLRALGIEPARTRRYLLRWRDKFRRGEFGVGGDLVNVQDGVAELRLVEVPFAKDGSKLPDSVATVTRSPGMRKVVLNVPVGLEEENLQVGPDEAKTPQGFMQLNGTTIRGPYVQPVKGTKGASALVKVQEGMWEHKRGQKVDGGERRKAEVRAKRRAAERKAMAA